MDLKLEPRESQRDARVMCECYPEATGKEILELVAHDRKCHELYIQKGQEKVRAFAKSINDAGAIYYKGRFGYDQRYYYKISNAEVESTGQIYADVEKIVCFIGDKQGRGGITHKDRIQIEKEEKEFKSLRNFSLENEKETTKEDWDKICKHLEALNDFWEEIKE